MEVTFQNQGCPCLKPVLRQARNAEQSQEIKLAEGMPDVGRILTAWGQPILRGKEWGSDGLTVTGGMMVWVLYTPEDGSTERCLDGWIPFQLRFELPEELPEGKICLGMLPRAVEARTVSPRKIQVRAGLSLLCQAFVPMEVPVARPQHLPEGVELLENTYPVRLWKEAGEKAFSQEETLTLPDSAPVPEELICYWADARVTDRKVLSQKLVFRGSTAVHLCYRCREGQLHCWDFDLPFSQYAELTGEYGPDAQTEFSLCLTGLELELDEEGRMNLKCGIAAQYALSDREQLELTQDAYSPGRELQIQMSTLELPVTLDGRRENLYAEQTLPGQGSLVVDSRFLPEYPRQRREGTCPVLEQCGTFQLLYYGEDGALHAGSARWEGTLPVTADEAVDIWAVPGIGTCQAAIGGSEMTLKAELPVELTAATVERLSVVTGLTLGESRKGEGGRPSLILCRAGERSLWDMAKAAGSTVASIREANDLQGEPAPDQMLLIPIL